jgi:hypothetical protein
VASLYALRAISAPLLAEAADRLTTNPAFDGHLTDNRA